MIGGSERAILGCICGPDEPFAEQPELVVAGKKVMLALLSKLRRQALLVPRVALRCFEVQVRSVLSYGAQLWGADAVIAVLAGGAHAGDGLSGCFERALQHPAVKLQREFLWALARVFVACCIPRVWAKAHAVPLG